MMRPSTRQNLALAFIFMLAVHDVSAARHGYNTAQMVSVAANRMEQSTKFHEYVAGVEESGSFSLQTMWARGKEDPFLRSLTWTNATITFSYADADDGIDSAGESRGGKGRAGKGGRGMAGNRHSRHTAKYVEVTGMDKKYRIMPDAVVMTKEMKSMAVVGISGWQALEGGFWGPSKYDRDEILWIRTEMNPIIGVTTGSTMSWRYAGYPVYQKGFEKPYYFYKGVQTSIDIEEVSLASEETPSDFHAEVAGHRTPPSEAPGRDLMLLLDAMLGQSSCLSSESLCLHRCVYNSDDDKCGPAAFCTDVAEGEMPSPLAPFGDQQKCKAVGGSSHEAADQAITHEGIPSLKAKALDVPLLQIFLTPQNACDLGVPHV